MNWFYTLFLAMFVSILAMKGTEMSYKKQFADAEKAGKTREMNYQPHEFKTAGDTIVGELMDIQDAYFEATKSHVNKYIMQTDDGLESAIFGAIGDAQLKDRIQVGDIIHAEFIEKKELTGGRTANIFKIKIIEREGGNGKKENDSSIND